MATYGKMATKYGKRGRKYGKMLSCEQVNLARYVEVVTYGKMATKYGKTGRKYGKKRLSCGQVNLARDEAVWQNLRQDGNKIWENRKEIW